VEALRVAVAGAGHLGTYHLQKIRELVNTGEALLAGVIETDAKKREKAAAEFGCPGAAALGELSGPLDAVIVATPTVAHREVAAAAIERGCSVLVEKPIAVSLDDGRALCELAKKKGVVLQVGHTERFNPAIAAALAVADRPRYITTERLGPFTGRSIDIDVVLDLMIHDLDIVGSLIDAPLAEVRAIGVPVLTREIDMANARLAFGDGSVAQLSAGRASLEPSRKIRMFTLERYVSIDCVAQEVKSVRRLPAEGDASFPQITGEPVEVEQGDALLSQDRDFIRCVREKRAPRVDGLAGVRALELAMAVKKALVVPLPAGVASPRERP
jgi:predicted dehydrogenase